MATNDKPITWTDIRLAELRARIDRARSTLRILAEQPQGERIERMMADCRDTIYASRAEIQRLSIPEQAAAHDARMDAEYKKATEEGPILE